MDVPSSDGVTVALHDLGGSGDPLVIAHANGFAGRVYEPLAAGLADHFHVWALDFRCHGDSTAVEEIHWHHIADDLQAVAEVLGGQGPVAVFGHSMGGGCALLVESRRPGTFRWAYVYEPIVLPDGLERTQGSPLSEGSRRRRETFPSAADALLRFASRPPLNVLRADSLHAYVVHGFREEPDGSIRLKCDRDDEARIFEATGAITLDGVRAASMPVTVAAGLVDSPWSPAGWSPEVAGALPHGRFEHHPTLGHFGPLQDPSGIAASILAAAGG